jgi:hypothetical protein
MHVTYPAQGKWNQREQFSQATMVKSSFASPQTHAGGRVLRPSAVLLGLVGCSTFCEDWNFLVERFGGKPSAIVAVACS